MSSENYLGLEKLDLETSTFFQKFLSASPENFTYTQMNDLLDTSFLNNGPVTTVSYCKAPPTVLEGGFYSTLTRPHLHDSRLPNNPQNLFGLGDMTSFDGTAPSHPNQSMSLDNLSRSSQSSTTSPFLNELPQYFDGCLPTQSNSECFGFNVEDPSSWDFPQNTTWSTYSGINKQYKENDTLSSQQSLACYCNDIASYNWAQFGPISNVAGPSSMGNSNTSGVICPQSYENPIALQTSSVTLPNYSSHQEAFQTPKERLEVGSSNSAALLDSNASATNGRCMPFVTNAGVRWDMTNFKELGANEFEGMISSNGSIGFLSSKTPAAPLYQNTELFQTAHVTFLDTSQCTNHQKNLGEKETLDSTPLKRKRKAEDGEVDSGSLALAALRATKKKVGTSDKSVQTSKLSHYCTHSSEDD
ncbi:hypothetical protein O181_034412 [Austropuccinia psidii MF-1]|uniref:Uncharacterized protein n=1 Tax=Austropuccinia psidii MF-1 TaxID=1389203 RepID=A0A9Q3H822_9BASI|nr:hypothetical protein [Austropuccinia psidii MF-1]